MESLSIIEGKSLEEWKLLLQAILSNQLAIMKEIRNLSPLQKHNNVPEYISVENAAEKFCTTKTTIYNKLKLFKKQKGKQIERLRSGCHNLILESDLLEAMKLQGEIPAIFQKK